MDTNQYMIDNALPGVFFDIGANVGYYTPRMATKATKVYAFEPSKLTYGTLVNAVTGLDNVVTEKIAVSNSNSKVKLYGPKYEVGSDWGGFTINLGLVNVSTTHESENYEEVDTITIDEYCAIHNITNITGMKIDVETAEQYVLEGAQETLKNNNILISLETHHPIDLIEVYKLIVQVGYSVYLNGDQLVDQLHYDRQYICRK